MKFEYILFDWDGCLAKTLDIWFFAAKELLLKNGNQVKDEQIINGFGNWNFAIDLGITDNESFVKELIFLADEKMKNVQLYNNVDKVLATLKNKGAKIALVTTAVKDSVIPVLEKYNLNKYFDVILTAEDVKKHKPNPEMVIKAINLLDADKSKTIIIGDSSKDIAAGNAAGINTVAFYPKENEMFYSLDMINSYKSDYVIDHLLDLLKVVN